MIKKTVLIIPFIDLPKVLKHRVRESFDNFGNDRYLVLGSDLGPCYDNETWQDTLSLESFQEYYKEQVDCNMFEGSFEQFVTDYGLEFEMWLIEEKVDLSGIEEIFINICW